ncbi:hypothetical protein A2U01_0086622, partial [Trifolium medium]|nr:hypothetical protein [Trifolium medium]
SGLVPAQRAALLRHAQLFLLVSAPRADMSRPRAGDRYPGVIELTFC